ncbi:MAG: hypothetical protein CMJ01_04145 [Pelagibacteraceae bacterium]|nr:hypothetical protein [Pelagibacteraceae bacterium]|tara:strand:- start:7595 stop:8572 length:978 start_codon:yes stop_codon:yes gene_type:complete
MIKNKKVLIIGFGSIGSKIFTILKKNKKIDIGILRTKQKVKKKIKAKFFFSIKDAQNYNPEYIFICTTANLHSIYFEKFKNLNAKIFIEKPLLFKENQIKIFKKYRKDLMVGYFLRYHYPIKYLKKYIERNQSSIRAINFEVGYDLKKWRPYRELSDTASAKKKYGGGALLELSHEIDLAVWMLGYPDEIFCQKQKLSKLKIDVDDFTNIILNYTKKKKCISINLDLLQTKYSRSIKIISNNQIVFYDYLKGKIEIFNKNKSKIINFKKYNLSKAYVHQINYFLQKFDNKKKKIKYFSNLTSSIQLSKLIFKLIQSDKLKRKIKI